MISFITAGESHGRALTAIAEGFPSNLKIDEDYINLHLKRRKMGYGRGQRMKIESDEAQILSGVRFGKTLGYPIALLIENNDWSNWTEIMSIEPKMNQEIERISIPRPGHADLVGVSKYNFDDIRNSIERSSARETAARVAVCSIARKFLEEFDIKIGSFVESVGGIYADNSELQEKLFHNQIKKIDAWKLALEADKSELRVFDKKAEAKMIRKIKEAKKNGDTLGGSFIIVATGAPIGLGSFSHYENKINAEIAKMIMSINAIKGVEIGKGFKLADLTGSKAHDEITINNKGVINRRTNYAGGIEGGITTGLPIIVRAAMKPIATLMNPINSVDLSNMKKTKSRRERSDFTAVPACAVIGESMMAWAIAKFFIMKFGGDSIEEIKDNYRTYLKNVNERVKKNFKKR